MSRVVPQTSAPMKLSATSWIIVALAVALHLYVALFLSTPGSSSFDAVLVLWSCTPYLAAMWLGSVAKVQLLSVVAAASSLAVDVLVFVDVFIAPTSSTASLEMLFGPLWSLLGIMIFGGATAWALSRRAGSAI